MTDEDREWRRLLSPLRELGDGASPEVEQILRAAFRRRRAARRRAWLLAATAAACLATLALLPRTRPAPPAPAPPPRALAKISPAPAPLPVAPRPMRHLASARPARPPARPAPAALTFYALPNTPVPGPIVRGQVVRVSLPGQALADLGFAVSPDRFFQPVSADVLLDEDGSPAALRFLPPQLPAAPRRTPISRSPGPF